jgi:hypothetical protein
MEASMKRKILSPDDLILLCKQDEEIIDMETISDGQVIPVVKAYDDESYSIHFWCNHCRKWHIHGRGGKDVPYREGRVGHSLAHCTSINSPYNQNGVILNVIGKFNDSIRKLHRRGTSLHCPKCHQQYSAALNACDCGARFINQKRKSSHPLMAEKYQQIIMGRD